MPDDLKGASGQPTEDGEEPFGEGEEEFTEQMSLLDAHREQLTLAELRATWTAFAAPLTSNAGAVVVDPALVELAVQVVGVFSSTKAGMALLSPRFAMGSGFAVYGSLRR